MAKVFRALTLVIGIGHCVPDSGLPTAHYTRHVRRRPSAPHLTHAYSHMCSMRHAHCHAPQPRRRVVFKFIVCPMR